MKNEHGNCVAYHNLSLAECQQIEVEAITEQIGVIATLVVLMDGPQASWKSLSHLRILKTHLDVIIQHISIPEGSNVVNRLQ